MKEAMIETSQLTKLYGNLFAVNRMNWTVPEGSICGLLGPNGAGKTTILKMFLGMTRPSSGTATINRFDILKDSVEIRRAAAFVPEDKLSYDSMTPSAFLKFYASFFGESSDSIARELAAKWLIPLDQKIGKLSKGVRTKLLFAAAIARKPQVMFLDEPTDGLDPSSAEEMLMLLTRWVSNGECTAVIATHRLEEMERICDRIAILNKGKLELSGDLDDVRTHWKSIEVTGNVPEEIIQQWKEVYRIEKSSGKWKMITRSNPNVVLERLQTYPLSVVNVFDMNLREIYLALIHFEGGIHDSLENLV
jgi:ABC-2 type transport system ATP-binding protein